MIDCTSTSAQTPAQPHYHPLTKSGGVPSHPTRPSCNLSPSQSGIQSPALLLYSPGKHQQLGQAGPGLLAKLTLYSPATNLTPPSPAALEERVEDSCASTHFSCPVTFHLTSPHSHASVSLCVPTCRCGSKEIPALSSFPSMRCFSDTQAYFPIFPSHHKTWGTHTLFPAPLGLVGCVWGTNSVHERVSVLLALQLLNGASQPALVASQKCLGLWLLPMPQSPQELGISSCSTGKTGLNAKSGWDFLSPATPGCSGSNADWHPGATCLDLACSPFMHDLPWPTASPSCQHYGRPLLSAPATDVPRISLRQVRGWDSQTPWLLQKAPVFSGKQEFGEYFGGLDTWP